MRRACRVLIAIILNCGLSSLVPGCDRDSVKPSCPEYQVGAIEGFVRGGGIPVQAKLRAIPLGTHNDRGFRTRTDSTGWYRMELPVGTYQLSLLPLEYPEGTSTFYSGMDTVNVGTARRRLDLNEGSLTIRATVPPFLEGRTISCRLEGGTADRDRNATVDQSILEWNFPLVLAGSFRVRLGLGGTVVWLPGTPDYAGAAVVDVGRAAPTVYEADLSATAELVGSVHGSWESMSVTPPIVRAFGVDSVRVGEATPGPDGAFALDVFPPQPVRILVGSERYGGSLWVGGDSYESAVVYELRAGEQTAGVEIKESGILCRLDWPDHEAEYDVSLILIDPLGHQILPYGWRSSGSIGIIGLSPGRYFLRLEHGCGVPWAPAWFDSSEAFTGATPIDIATCGETVEITMHLTEGGRIDGAILPFPGQAPSNHRVVLLDSEGASICDSVSDESFGAFSFQGLANGVYRVAVELSWDERWWYPGTEDPDSAGTITVIGHAAVSGIEWRMP